MGDVRDCTLIWPIRPPESSFVDEFVPAGTMRVA